MARLDKFVLSNNKLSVTIIPHRGGKIARIFDHRTEKELLEQPRGRVGYGYRLPEYGAPFNADQAWGWDEMFPAITAESFTDDRIGTIDVPDHGEVWSLPWYVINSASNRLTIAVSGRITNYRLVRTTTLVGETIRNTYHLTNTGDRYLPWIWASHPLFFLTNKMYLQAPNRWDRVRNAFDSPIMSDVGRTYPFPGNCPVLDRLPIPNTGIALKYFFEDKAKNGEGLDLHSQIHNRGNYLITFRGSTDVVPWYGVWLNSGALFGHNNIAVEIASAPMDRLSAAHKLGRLPFLPPGQDVSWWMDVTILLQADFASGPEIHATSIG